MSRLVQISNERKSKLVPAFREMLEKFEKECLKNGLNVFITNGYRSISEQNALYAKGRTTPGSIVTNAKGGYSWHNFGLAADYCFVVDGKITWNGDWDKFGKIARDCGFEWGGDWKKFADRPHIQWRNGRTLAQMRAGAK